MGICSAQNFSGLQNKKLNRIDDIGSLLESGLGSLFGGKLKGTIDSVIVTYDAEKTMKVRVFYTGFDNGFFAVSTMSDAKKKQNEITAGKFSRATAASPAECSLTMNASVAKGTKIESPYLRIDIGKSENKPGQVVVFALNKKWKTDLDPQNVVINVALRPVGIAANLKSNEVKDVMPAKNIEFDPKVLYYTPADTKLKTLRTGGGNLFYKRYTYSSMWPVDISGTWVNADAETRGITKLVVVNNETIQGFGKCSPQDCDWGKTTITSLGGNSFRAVFEWSYKKTTLNIVYGSNQLTATQTDTYTAGGATKTYTYTFKKNLQMVYLAPRIYTLSQVATMNTDNPAGQPVSRTPQGPDKNIQINLWDGLTVDNQVEFRRPQDLSNISMNIFADKNINSGIYYMLPADYHLRWETKTEPEKGYDFRILYGAMRSEGAEPSADAPVRMSATLTAGISTREKNFVKALLKAARPDFVDVRFLPLRENPQFTFQNTLGAQYNIPQNKITVETSTDLNNDIRIAWQTDADTKEFIQTALTSREGIAASVILKPDNEDILDQQIPALINLADIRTLGKINIEPVAWRTRNWRNTTPYPLQLNYLHVLKKETDGNKPIVYSWSMNDVVIPSQAQVTFDSHTVPAWLDNDESVVMWIDYSVMSCSDCDQKVMDAVTGGVSGSKAQQIKFTIPPAVFDTLKAAYFLVTIRSKQVDPKGEQVKELAALKITNDAAKEFSAGPLFIAADGAIDFEYKITVATKDGDFYPANDWIKATGKDILLGKTRMKEIFSGIIPGIN
jgi:hypothetical protein